MADYTPLFTLTVEHGYYDGGVPPALGFTPVSRTAVLIKNCGLLIKPVAGGIIVLQNKKEQESLALHAADKEDPLELVFKVYAEDVAFKSKTDVLIDTNEAIPFFHNHVERDDTGGRSRLHEANDASMIDLVKLDSNQFNSLLDHRDRRMPPLFIVSIRLKEKALKSIEQEAPLSLKNYYIKFKERQLYWKYYLVGSMARETLFLIDMDRKAEFISLGKELLDGQRDAVTFRSAHRLPLKEMPQYRFQLKEKGNGSEKVIIKRLPMADVSRFGRAEIDGRQEVVSEIYINC